MFTSKILTLNNEKITALTQFIVLSGAATIAPFFHQQIITGTLINAILFVATILLGYRAAILIGIIPSLIALSLGTLAAPLAPMLPFIIMSNIILILTFNFLKNKNYSLAVFASIFLKFLFLCSSTYFLLDLILNKNLSSSLIIQMTWPQLITALSGALLATLILKIAKKYQQ